MPTLSEEKKQEQAIMDEEFNRAMDNIIKKLGTTTYSEVGRSMGRVIRENWDKYHPDENHDCTPVHFFITGFKKGGLA